MYPNVTSPTRVHGGSNRHDALHQLSRAISVTIVDLVRVEPDDLYRRIDDLDKNRFYFVLHFETSSVIDHCKSSHKSYHT